MTTNWTDLVVTDSDGDVAGTLGEMVRTCPANLDTASIVFGETGNPNTEVDSQIQEWPGFSLSSPDVDWSGFGDAIRIARAS